MLWSAPTATLRSSNPHFYNYPTKWLQEILTLSKKQVHYCFSFKVDLSLKLI